MTERLVRGWGRGCLQALAIRLIVGAVVLVIGGLCIVPAVYLLNDSQPGDPAFLLGLGLVFGFLGLAVAGTIAVAAWLILGRAHALDAAFVPLGLKGSLYLIGGRQYQGQVNGRQVTVFFYRGPVLDLFVQADTRTRVGISVRDRLSSAVAGALNRTPLATTEPELSRLSIYPADEAWARGLLADPAARGLITRLTTEQGSIEIRQLYVQPAHLLLKLIHTQAGALTEAIARQMVDDLIAVARIAEALPRPRQAAQPLPFEGGDPSTRGRLNLYVAAGVVLAVVVVPLCVLIPFILIEILNSGR